jgi:hypothetical protein
MFKTKKYEDRLMSALKFSEFDLKNNQVGLMTYRQARHLRSARIAATLSWTMPFLLGIGGLSAWFTAMLATTDAPLDAILLPLLGVIALSGWLYAYYGLRVNRLNDDLRENRVSAVEGRVELGVATGNKSAAYWMRIDMMRFPLTQAAFLAFKNGDPYRIYFAPHSKQILSVEWLREDEDNNPFDEFTLVEDDVDEKRKVA